MLSLKQLFSRSTPPPYFAAEKRQFIPVPEEELDQDGSSGSQNINPLFQRNPYRRALYAVSGINLFLLAVSAFFFSKGYSYRQDVRQNRNNELLRISDWYSPVHNEAQIRILDKKVNGSLLNMDHSLFRSPPSPEVDAAWERVGSLMPHVISTDDVVRLGKDPSQTARWPEAWGFGPDAHVAELDVLHTIHCLNAVRRDVHWKHYFGADYPDGDFPALHRVHTDHCIYVVLQNLMCSATADVITQPWVVGQSHPFPDFSINKKCRDFDAILDWHERTMIRDTKAFMEIKKPENFKAVPMSEEFHELFQTGEGNGHGEHHH
ncbi:hypothetical protein V2A60_000067 [Cordyceps javanica]|uniref:Tat pathway signal sequence n=1 Tax=Cordyceps javanica TaxID=43265 RepID=A0A545V6F5_9HYPO|nr:tat pathway signal sequence [Cordyceps javanica]TQW08551.1 tat pathway signal sequence [Cordyceps javanica]